MLKHTLFPGITGWLLSTLSNTPGISEKSHFHENTIVDPDQSPRKTNDRQAREVLFVVLHVLEQRGDGNGTSELILSFPLSLGVGPAQRIG